QPTPKRRCPPAQRWAGQASAGNCQSREPSGSSAANTSIHSPLFTATTSTTSARTIGTVCQSSDIGATSTLGGRNTAGGTSVIGSGHGRRATVGTGTG